MTKATHHSKHPTPTREALAGDWGRLIGGPLPVSLSTARIQMALSYARQVSGDPQLARLDQRVNKRLKQLARQTARTRALPRPGTRLLREWGGETHEVTVTEDGYRYRAKTYTSLSAVAGTITGARWSGPKFFGLPRS